MAKRSLTFEPIEHYVSEVITRDTPIQKRLRAETAKLPNSQMQIGPDQGTLMALLARAIGARRALEIGTFTGYSALAVATALPQDGKLITCDRNEEWTRIARRYWQEARLANRIELRLGPALGTLGGPQSELGPGPFPFAFIQAAQEEYHDHYHA